MCSGQNSLGKGGLNERYGLCKSSINRYVNFLPSDGTMYEINQYAEYVDLIIVLTRKD